MPFEKNKDNNEKRRFTQSITESEPIRITVDFSPLKSLPMQMRNYFTRLIELGKFFFSHLLKVKPIVGPIMPTIDNCHDFNLPEDDKIFGIAYSDLHIYVTFTNDPSSSLLTYGLGCMHAGNEYNGRVVIGRFNYNIDYFNKINLNSNNEFERSFVATLHDMMHIFAFTTAYYPYFRDENGNPYDIATTFPPGFIKTPKVKHNH